MTGRTVIVARVMAAVVALVAGYVSYLHIVDVALVVGERPEVAYALPVTIDALMVMSTLALLHDRRHRWAQAGFLFGVAVSVTCNVASAEPSWPARGVAAIPAVALLLAVEVLVRSGARTATGRTPPRTRSRTRPRITGRTRPRSATRTTAADKVARAAAKRPDATVAELARLSGLSERTVRRHNGHQNATTVDMAAP